MVNLRELAETLAAAGVEVTWDGEFPGHDRFYAADPFGQPAGVPGAAELTGTVAAWL